METLFKIAFVVAIFLIFKVEGQDEDYRYSDAVEDLRAETDFRSVKLQWHYEKYPEPIGFYVTLCEISQWMQTKNCFERHLLNGKGSSLGGYDILSTDGEGHYVATLYGLRMLTNYTVSVHAIDDQNRIISVRVDDRRAKIHSPESLLVTTKGFSAYATNCYANSSDIVVHSGPYFGGKISVEGSVDDRCSIYGNRSSPVDTYTLRIDHHICGSKTVNDSRIDTVVVVHESSSVVTHNSRRFLVQCSFLPETFTIKAAFNVPQEEDNEKHNLKYKEVEEALKNLDSNDIFTYEHYRQNNIKDSRISSEQVQSVLHGNFHGYESQMLSLLIVVIVLIIIIVVVIGFGLWCYIHNHRRRSSSADIETMSTSGSSFTAYQVGDNDALMRPISENGSFPVSFNDVQYSQTFPRNVNQFFGTPVALVSLKPVKELY